MRTAFISDIHGHYLGLKTVLVDIEKRSCDRIVCLGDLVEGGADDEKVVRTVQELNISCVQGNHDFSNALKLAPDVRSFLDGLPIEREENDLLFCHISAREKQLKIRTPIEAWNVFDETTHRLIFTGHQHLPLIYGEKSKEFGAATSHDFQYNEDFLFQPKDRYIVCVGSVAYGRDGIGKLRYAIYDSAQDSLQHRTVDGPLLKKDYTFLWNEE